MKMEHKKCLEITFCLNAQIEPILRGNREDCLLWSSRYSAVLESLDLIVMAKGVDNTYAYEEEDEREKGEEEEEEEAEEDEEEEEEEE